MKNLIASNGKGIEHIDDQLWRVNLGFALSPFNLFQQQSIPAAVLRPLLVQRLGEIAWTQRGNTNGNDVMNQVCLRMGGVLDKVSQNWHVCWCFQDNNDWPGNFQNLRESRHTHFTISGWKWLKAAAEDRTLHIKMTKANGYPTSEVINLVLASGYLNDVTVNLLAWWFGLGWGAPAGLNSLYSWLVHCLIYPDVSAFILARYPNKCLRGVGPPKQYLSWRTLAFGKHI